MADTDSPYLLLTRLINHLTCQPDSLHSHMLCNRSSHATIQLRSAAYATLLTITDEVRSCSYTLLPTTTTPYSHCQSCTTQTTLATPSRCAAQRSAPHINPLGNPPNHSTGHVEPITQPHSTCHPAGPRITPQGNHPVPCRPAAHAPPHPAGRPAGTVACALSCCLVFCNSVVEEMPCLNGDKQEEWRSCTTNHRAALQLMPSKAIQLPSNGAVQRIARCQRLTQHRFNMCRAGGMLTQRPLPSPACTACRRPCATSALPSVPPWMHLLAYSTEVPTATVFLTTLSGVCLVPT